MERQMYVNPLAFVPVDFSNPDGSTDKLTVEEVLGFLGPPGTRPHIDSLVERYRELGPVPMGLRVIPAEQGILSRIAWPLREARASYTVGNHLSVIALCGIVAEMVAIFLWKITGLKIDERKLFGNKFDSLAQHRRTDVLHVCKAITQENKGSFDKIRSIRNRYLHNWSADYDALQTDAREAIHETVLLVEIAIGAEGFQDGVVIEREGLREYLDREGRAD